MQISLVAGLLIALAVFHPRGEPATRALRGCEQHLFDVQAKLNPVLVGDDFLGTALLSNQPTVRVIGDHAGRFGGRRLIVERTGLTWVSKHKSLRFDPQGDPRWLIDSLGPAAAKFFGFEMLDEWRMTVPDPDEFAGALRRLNAVLPTPVAISYYATETDANVRVADYVAAFARAGAIPLARGGNHLIHDLSFHSGAIFLPPEVIALKRASALYLQSFILYLRAKYPDGPRRAAVSFFAFHWRFRETQSIDVATALINPGIINFMRDPQANDDFFMLSPLRTLTNQGQALPETMRQFIKDLEGKSHRALEGNLDFLNFKKAEAHLKHLDVRTMRVDLADFQRAYDPTGVRTIAPFAAQRGPRALARLCHALQLRRLEISAAAIRLLAEGQ